jgi:hypothetical protein
MESGWIISGELAQNGKSMRDITIGDTKTRGSVLRGVRDEVKLL